MEEVIQYVPNLYATFWALIPPLVAIILALITKEVYSSLFVGIVIGGLFYGNIFQSGFSFEKSVLHIFEDGLVGVLSDPYNVGILVFLVVLGIMVCMMNKAGGSAAFGEGLVNVYRGTGKVLLAPVSNQAMKLQQVQEKEPVIVGDDDE